MVTCLWPVASLQKTVEGLHFEAADWHAGNKFFEVFEVVYSINLLLIL